MSEDIGKKSGISWLAMSLLSLIFVAALGAGYLYLPALMPETSTDIVMIQGEEGPFKTKPADPGGKIITNQDSKVMKMLGDLTPETEKVETLLPPSAAPELPPVAVETSPKPRVQLADNNDSNSETIGKAGSETDYDRENAPAVKKPAKAIVATPKPMEPESKPITRPRVAVDPNEPVYIVQLAAFRKEDVAAEQAGLLLKKHEKRLQDTKLGTIRIDTSDNGIFWRVVSEPLPREAADTICASLKRAGQDCILRKVSSPSQ